MKAYYNEIDPFAAQWLRNLIAAGHIAPGDVDTRSITDVSADDLKGYSQVHLFAGIGGWSRALRLAGVPDTAPFWTGSPPCQPFSTAGRRKGAADARHLWPEMFRLVRERRPVRLAGEQVAAAIGLNWLDAVSDDLESAGYAVGAIVLPACSVGAPHIRQRCWFVAESDSGRRERARVSIRPRRQDEATPKQCGDSTRIGALGDTKRGRQQGSGEMDGPCNRTAAHRETDRVDRASDGGITARFWHPADWLPCRDGKARPVEPGAFPLAYGVSARVGRLRGYGNAIVPQVAAEVIRAFMEYAPE